MSNNLDIKYMKKCLSLAKRGKGKVSPNPLVGCVVLNKKGEIISTGYHHKYGGNHAERDALLKLKKGEAEGGTLYVNLEPCSHQGKTPPCTDIILEHKLVKVVFGMKDPNKKVNGAKILQNAGIDVVSGVLEDEAKFLNRIFVKNMTKKLPYVVLKTATTMDGKIAAKTGDSKWITSEKSRKEVYKMRKDFDCILTSSNTVIADNPVMKHSGIKCILDKNNRIPKNAQIFKQGKIYIASKENTPLKNGDLDLEAILKELYKQGICSVFVECGGKLGGAFLKEGLIDEIYQFIAPKILNDNEGFSPFNSGRVNKINNCVNLSIYEIKKIPPDILIKSVVL